MSVPRVVLAKFPTLRGCGGRVQTKFICHDPPQFSKIGWRADTSSAEGEVVIPTGHRLETIQDRVLRVISTARCVPLGSVRPECTFEDLGVDSLDRLDILFELEAEFQVEIDGTKALEAVSVIEVITAVTRLVQGTPTAPPEN